MSEKVVIMLAKVKLYDRCKYDKNSKKVGELLYDIICFKVEYIEYVETGDNTKDDYDECLILYLSNGETATFYNSMVDLFIY